MGLQFSENSPLFPECNLTLKERWIKFINEDENSINKIIIFIIIALAFLGEAF